MINLIPQYIVNNYKEKRFEGHLEAVTMFIDISGFTAMTQSLMRNGDEGAEILTEIINRIFTPSIDIIYQNKGFISTFAGDAFTSIFPKERIDIDSAIYAAVEIQKIFQQIGIQKTRFGTFELQVRIGLSLGEMEWKIIQTEDMNSFYFKGEAIYRATECEHLCSVGEIIIDNTLKRLSKGKFSEKSSSYYIVNSVPAKPVIEIQKIKLTQKELQPFIPDSILHLKSKGEFRSVISCFISFQQKENFHLHLSRIIRLSNEYGGYFNKIDFSDKGGVILVLFGAPISKEQMEIRACDFALEVIKLKGFFCRIGLSFGTAFTGFIGSDKRGEYTALGMAVNVAARFMMKANWTEIFLDRFIYDKIKDNYQIQNLEELELKGFQYKIPSYKLQKKKERSTTFISTGKLIARESEFDKLKKIIKPLNRTKGNKFGGVVYVEGVAGIGKSRLIKEFKMSLDRNDYNWIYMPCDAILRKSFNPVKYFLYWIFGQSEENDHESNRNIFEGKIEELIKTTTDEKLKSELIRTKSFLGALINLGWENSLYEQLDPKNKYENILYAVTNLIKILSMLKPVIIEFEDSNFIDVDTKNLLHVLTRNVQEYPFMIICSCRFNDDHTKFRFGLSDVKETRIILKVLDREKTKELIKDKLEIEKEIPEKTFKLIWEKSEGNPFYVEQIIFYLKEEGIINDKLQITKRKIKIPANINSVIIARVDKLNPELKNITKKASVLGNQFTDNVLKSMTDDNRIDSYILDGEKQNIWYSLSKANKAFQNAFIRESIYGLILKKELRNLHKSAAETFETLYTKDLKPYYADIAFNYERAEINDKTAFYFEKAGDYAKDLYQNQAALEYYDNLLENLELQQKTIHNTILKTKLNKIELYLQQSETKTAEQELIKLKTESFFDPELKDRFHYLSAKLYTITENYIMLKKYIRSCITDIKTKLYKNHLEIFYLDTLRFLNEVDEFEKKSKSLLKNFRNQNEHFFEGRTANIMGVYHLQKANYKKALEFFQLNHKIVKKLKNKMLIRAALHNIGIVHSRLGDKQKAMKFYLDSLKVAEEIGSKSACSKLLSNIANIYTAEGKSEKAIEYYNKSLDIARTIGNKMSEGLNLFNIGLAYHYLDKYTKSIQFLVKSKNICEKISDKIGITYANDTYGDNLFCLEKFDEAKEIYLENLELQKELNDPEGIAHTYGNLGNIAKSKNNYDEAENYYKLQQRTLAEIGDKEGEGKAYFNWAMIEIEKERPKDAIPKLEKALELFEACSFKMGADLAKEQLEKIK